MTSKTYWTAYFIAIGIMVVIMGIMLYGLWQ